MTGVIYAIYTQAQVDMKPQCWYKTYNDTHNRLHQSEHPQWSCKLTRVGDDRVVYKCKKECRAVGNIDVQARYRIYYM